MKKTAKKTIEVEYTEDLICNKCGESLKHIITTDGDFNFCGLEEITVNGCYGSDPLEDLVSYTFSLCEKCLDDLFKSFKIPVEKKDYYI